MSEKRETAPGLTEAQIEVIRQAIIDAAVDAYDDAQMRGLCHEGAWELALQAMREVKLAPPAGPGDSSPRLKA